MYILDKIYEIAQASPEKVALVYNGEEFSYRHLYRAIMANRRRLLAEAGGSGRFAVVLVRKIPDAWATALAIGSLGYATAAVGGGSEMPSVSRLDLALVLIRAEEARRMEALTSAPAGVKVVEIAGDFASDGLGDDELEAPPPGPPIGHVLLSSGTTGAYKCILIPAEREAALKLVPPTESVINLLGFGLWTALGFSTPIGIWCGGGTVIFHQGPEPHRSFRYKRITHAFVTPAYLADILRGPEGSFPRHEALRLTVFGGPLSASLAEAAKRRLAPTVLTAFGSSEVGNWGLTEVQSDMDLRWHKISPGWTVEIVDEAGQVLPTGQLGQVRVKVPAGLPQSYHEDAEATASFFRDGFFFPGDLGVADAEGRIAFRGRVTNVINVLGDKRPAEPYEQALQDRLGVDAVCVMSEPGADQAEALHVVIETPAPIDQARLSKAMTGVFVGFPEVRVHFVSSMPRNHMGKVLRLALRRQIVAGQAAAAATA